jgi:hypothetical protein
MVQSSLDPERQEQIGLQFGWHAGVIWISRRAVRATKALKRLTLTPPTKTLERSGNTEADVCVRWMVDAIARPKKLLAGDILERLRECAARCISICVGPPK